MKRNRSKSGAFFALAFLTLLWAGCSDSGSGSSSSNEISGTVTEILPGMVESETPVSDVLVCQFNSNNCATTDENGFYSLLALMNQNILLSYVKEGFGPVLVAIPSRVTNITADAGMSTNETLAEFFDSIGAAFPPVASGYLTANTFRDGTPIARINYRLVGSDGLSFYFDDEGVADTSLIETQTPGSGGFVDVAPVDVELVVQGAANCVAANSWPAPAADAFRLPIRVGFWTQTVVECE